MAESSSAFPHHVANEVRHVPGRHKLVQRGRQKPALMNIIGAKHLGHGLSESPSGHAVEMTTRTGS